MKLPVLSLLLCWLTAVSSFILEPALSAVNAAFELNPYAAGAFVTGLNAVTADIVAQKRQSRKTSDEQNSEVMRNEDRKGLDIRRTLGFLVYGAIYQGLAQGYIYNRLYPTLFGVEATTINVVKKVFCDMFIQTPILTLPVAYYSKALVLGITFKQAMDRYVGDVKNQGLLFKFWCLWTPVQFMTFSIIPEHFRVSFIAAVAFFWLIILSSISGGNDGVDTESSENIAFKTVVDTPVKSRVPLERRGSKVVIRRLFS